MGLFISVIIYTTNLIYLITLFPAIIGSVLDIIYATHVIYVKLLLGKID